MTYAFTIRRGAAAPPTPPPGHASARTAEKPLDPGALLPRFGPGQAGAPAPTRAARPLAIAAPPAEPPAHAAGPEGTEGEGWPQDQHECPRSSYPPSGYDDATAGTSKDGRLLRTMGSSRMESTITVASSAQAPAA